MSVTYGDARPVPDFDPVAGRPRRSPARGPGPSAQRGARRRPRQPVAAVRAARPVLDDCRSSDRPRRSDLRSSTRCSGLGAYQGTRCLAAAPHPQRRRARLTVRGRRLRALLVLAAVGLIGWPAVSLGFGGLTAPGGSPLPGSAPASVVVRPGESVWGVAARVAPGADPRLVVTILTERNHLGHSAIHAGQRLTLSGAGAAR